MHDLPGSLPRPDFIAILEALASGVSIANAEGRIIYSNGAANRTLGMIRTDAPPSEWASHYGVFVPGTDEPFPESDYPLVRALKGEDVDGVEMLIRNPILPGDVTIECSARPLHNGSESLEGAVVIFRDVTDLRKARADLERSNEELRRTHQMKEELYAFVVHDLKTPIATVMALAELMQTAEEMDPEQVRADAAEIRSAADRMHRMVLDLLDVQVAEDGGLGIERTVVRVRELLEDVRKGVRPRAPGIAIGQVDPDLQLSVDQALIFRLLVNLIDNCVKYGPPGGRILLNAVAERDGSVCLSAADEGPGVPEELRERIFEKYAQLERGADRRSADSRGLGLRFCRVVAEAHGGQIWVEDAEPKGARFCVRLATAGIGKPEDLCPRALGVPVVGPLRRA